MFTNSPEKNIAQINTPDFYRVDSSQKYFFNQGMVLGFSGTSGYFSIAPACITQFLIDTEHSNLMMSFKYCGLNERSIMQSLAAVKYYGQRDSDKQLFGYQKTPVENILYNQYSLPLGYTYDKILSYHQWNSLNGIEREEAMLQGVYLDAPNEKEIHNIETLSMIESMSKEIPVISVKESNVSWNQDTGELQVKKDKGSLTLEFSSLENTETYLRFNNFNIRESGKSEFTITISCDGRNEYIYPKGETNEWYFERGSYAVNLGYGLEVTQTCKITFPKKGTYHLENLEVYARSMEDFPQYVKQLKAEPLKDIKLSPNKINGSIELSIPKILCLSLPYSKGWTAFVDGIKTEILPANVMYMAIPLEAGHHEIELIYCTPGIKLGAAVSAFGLVLLLLLFIKQNKNRKDNTR